MNSGPWKSLTTRILWYCSDNGGLNEQTSGGRERKGSIYEGGLRIPGIIEWPARQLKGRTAVPTWTCDMYPTLLGWAGVEEESPHPLDGIDISDTLSGESTERAKPMGFWHHFQKGQSTWSDRILKAIMEKQQAGDPLPHDRERVRKDVDEFPPFAEGVTTGHAAWNAWPWEIASQGRQQVRTVQPDGRPHGILGSFQGSRTARASGRDATRSRCLDAISGAKPQRRRL